MLTIELNMYHAVALGAFLFWLGGVITDKVSLLSRYCIPAPLVGGLCFSILNCILYSTGIASINFDATLQTVFKYPDHCSLLKSDSGLDILLFHYSFGSTNAIRQVNGPLQLRIILPP